MNSIGIDIKTPARLPVLKRTVHIAPKIFQAANRIQVSGRQISLKNANMAEM